MNKKIIIEKIKQKKYWIIALAVLIISVTFTPISRSKLAIYKQKEIEYNERKKQHDEFVEMCEGYKADYNNLTEEYDEITAIDKNISTKSMVKVVSNKVMVLRPDITISLMKSLIPRWEDDLNLKLFYHSTVYKNKKNGDGIIQCRQFGCEY